MTEVVRIRRAACTSLGSMHKHVQTWAARTTTHWDTRPRTCAACRHQKRVAYAHSLAVNSMVGFVIGLGDRHCSNILIDSATSELVHIDLGIAFEGGRYTPTPELVPFRLTRDLVDALGVTGVEGAMRRCCEATLRVMRASRPALLTLIEVRSWRVCVVKVT